jgi:hypothetical protein
MILLSTLFKESGNFESFKNEVIKLDGNFDFSLECMMDLGSAYLEKYPDKFSRRNIDEVHIGYKVVRVCVIEKIIKAMDSKKKEIYRKILNDFPGSLFILDGIIKNAGYHNIINDYKDMTAELKKISLVIDEIPKGMIKERFIGGVTNIVNILYLLNMKLKNIENNPASG